MPLDAEIFRGHLVKQGPFAWGDGIEAVRGGNFQRIDSNQEPEMRPCRGRNHTRSLSSRADQSFGIGWSASGRTELTAALEGRLKHETGVLK